MAYPVWKTCVEDLPETLISLGFMVMAERMGFEPAVVGAPKVAPVLSAMEWLADRQDSNGMISTSA
jgi:hypothetical protein